MIATIVCGLLLIIAIVIIVLSVKGFGELLGIEFMLGGFVLAAFLISMCWGHIPSKSCSDMLRDKEDLIILYENCPCERHIREVIDHNDKVERGNNLWCRFKIEDRNEYKIDINELLKGEQKCQTENKY